MKWIVIACYTNSKIIYECYESLDLERDLEEETETVKNKLNEKKCLWLCDNEKDTFIPYEKIDRIQVFGFDNDEKLLEFEKYVDSVNNKETENPTFKFITAN